MPDKHSGLSDPQSRVRMRYVDLIVNPAARQMAELRASVTRAIREELHAQGYVEAETPMLQTLHGGANARPFVTHINAYDMKMYLRIALELYLKRLMVGGLEKVYELGRNLRNEGADATHNPEFTMLGVRGLRRLQLDRRHDEEPDHQRCAGRARRNDRAPARRVRARYWRRLAVGDCPRRGFYGTWRGGHARHRRRSAA